MSRRHIMLSELENDPFFGYPKDRFASFEEFFANDPFRRPFEAIEGTRGKDRDKDRNRGGDKALERYDSREDPFHGWFGNMFTGFDRAFQGMREEMGRLHDNADAHSYSHSSVMSYSTGEDGKPKYYQATSSNRSAPGGIKETRKTVRDSERELAKMALGRHIGERGHVMEKSENTRTGQREEKQDFHGLEQSDLTEFDREWQDKTRSFRRAGALGDERRDRDRDHRHRDRRAIEGQKQRK